MSSTVARGIGPIGSGRAWSPARSPCAYREPDRNALAVFLRDRFAYGRDDLPGPAAEGDDVLRAATGREEREARRTVLQYGPGQFLDPLVDGTADPAAGAVTRGGQRPVGDPSGENAAVRAEAEDHFWYRQCAAFHSMGRR